MRDKREDLAGPGIGNYDDLEKVLPTDYNSLLNRKETQIALAEAKKYIEEGLCRELKLMRVECPLIMDKDSGMNDYLDRDGMRTPVDFPAGLGLPKRIEAQVVQAVTKWKRFALTQYEMDAGEGIYSDMRAIRKDYFLDHDHSSYVDQWEWERVMTKDERNLEFLKEIVRGIWRVIVGAEKHVQKLYPQLKDDRYPNLPEELVFIHAEEILEMFPDLPRKSRENAILQKYPAVFIIGIGWTLEDGDPHEMRVADYATIGSPPAL